MSERLSSDSVPLNDTPTTTSNQTPNSSNDSASLDDINYLLYLETLKRFKDEETNLRRQVDEKAHQYEDVKSEYRYMFELYVSLFEDAVLRQLLEAGHILPYSHITQVTSDVLTVAEKVNKKNKAYLDPDILSQCTEILHGIKNYNETQAVQTALVDQKDVVKNIRSLIESIQLQLEAATTQSLDYFVELAQTEEKPHLINQDQNQCETNMDA